MKNTIEHLYIEELINSLDMYQKLINIQLQHVSKINQHMTTFTTLYQTFNCIHINTTSNIHLYTHLSKNQNLYIHSLHRIIAVFYTKYK
jgi:hypothetical protein